MTWRISQAPPREGGLVACSDNNFRPKMKGCYLQQCKQERDFIQPFRFSDQASWPQFQLAMSHFFLVLHHCCWLKTSSFIGHFETQDYPSIWSCGSHENSYSNHLFSCFVLYPTIWIHFSCLHLWLLGRCQAVTYQKAYPTEPFRHMMCAPSPPGAEPGGGYHFTWS